jgi:hypothetical protein
LVSWFILAEALIGSFWDGLSRWVPAAVSSVLTAGSAGVSGMMGGATPGISYPTAILIAIGYSLLALAITSTVLARRDVTSQRSPEPTMRAQRLKRDRTGYDHPKPYNEDDDACGRAGRPSPSRHLLR